MLTVLTQHRDIISPMETTGDWRHAAACRGTDPELFFPIGNTGLALVQIEEAKQICRRCGVLDQCLRFAIDTGQDAGVWGGMSEAERVGLKRRQRERAGLPVGTAATRQTARKPPASRLTLDVGLPELAE